MTERSPRARRWQALTAGSLLVGYAGYYVCRSNLSIVGPMLLAEFGSRGFDKAALGLISSAGVLAYAAGKGITGVASDMLGGRRLFIAGMIGSVAATLAFGASSGLAAFLVVWAINRFVQSVGWGALVKIASHWFEPQRYGTVMGVLSLSFLFGDAAGRLWLGALVSRGAGWRTVFVVAAATLAVVAIVCVHTLKESPRDIGLDEPAVSERNVYGEAGSDSQPESIRELLEPYLTNRAFWLVCLISLGLTLVRESFNAWIPTYLVEGYGLTQGDAAQKSALFPFVGGVSVLLIGGLSDRVRVHRMLLAVPLLAGCAVALAALSGGAAIHSERLGLVLLASIAFLLIGPYSLLAGAMAVDLGGRHGSATAAGLIDTAGYLGAVLSGALVGVIVQRFGWVAVFRLQAVVAGAAAALCALFWFHRHDHAAADAVKSAVEKIHAY